MGLQVLTASRLSDAHPVYLDARDNWSEWVEDGQVAATAEEAEALMGKGKAAEAACVVWEFYLVDVTRENGTLRPVRLREVIRANGPTTHPRFGLQLERAKRQA